MFSSTHFQLTPFSPAQHNNKQEFKHAALNASKNKILFSGHDKDTFTREFQARTDSELPEQILEILTKPFFDSNIAIDKKVRAVESYFVLYEDPTQQNPDRDIHKAEAASGVAEKTLLGWGFRESKDDDKDRRTTEPVRRSSRHNP
jgi:hypothetical protein